MKRTYGENFNVHLAGGGELLDELQAAIRITMRDHNVRPS